MNTKSLFEPTYPLSVSSGNAKHFVIIGAGGNGGYLIPNLLRQISLQNRIMEIKGKRTKHIVTIIDADIVEDKNLTRQNFIQRDVGLNKAEVMANRYGAAFGLEVNFIPEYLSSSEMLTDILNETGSLVGKSVIIGCVDNNKTRAIIHDVFVQRAGTFWIDAGNEEWAGQVVVGYKAKGGEKVLPRKGIKSPHAFDLPSVTELYPEILEATDKLPHELSCAERAVSNPQNIQTNQTAANLIMGFCNTILTAPDEEGLKAHAVNFNAQDHSFSTRLNKFENLIIETPDVEKQEEPEASAEEEVPVEEKSKKEKKKVEVVIAPSEEEETETEAEEVDALPF